MAKGQVRADPLRAVHRSMVGGRRIPYNMETIKVPHEVREGLTNVALSIFTDCCNANCSFQDAILAVYLSGLEHGMGGGEE